MTNRAPKKEVHQSVNRRAIAWLSALIALIWSLQFLVSVPLSFRAPGLRRSWPIIDYPMYSLPHFEGDKIQRLAVVGISATGGEVEIQPEDVGGYWHYRILAEAVERADEDIVRDVVRIYESRHNLRLTALRVEDRPLLWRSGRVVPAPIKVLRDARMDRAEP